MSKVSKVIVTIVIIVIFVFLYAIIFGVRSETGNRTPGILGLVVFAGMIGAIRAVWKKDKKEDEDNLPDKK